MKTIPASFFHLWLLAKVKYVKVITICILAGAGLLLHSYLKERGSHMRPIDADELIERVWSSSIRSKRSTTELIKESKTITDFSKINENEKKEG